MTNHFSIQNNTSNNCPPPWMELYFGPSDNKTPTNSDTSSQVDDDGASWKELYFGPSDNKTPANSDTSSQVDAIFHTTIQQSSATEQLNEDFRLIQYTDPFWESQKKLFMPNLTSPQPVTHKRPREEDVSIAIQQCEDLIVSLEQWIDTPQTKERFIDENEWKKHDLQAISLFKSGQFQAAITELDIAHDCEQVSYDFLIKYQFPPLSKNPHRTLLRYLLNQFCTTYPDFTDSDRKKRLKADQSLKSVHLINYKTMDPSLSQEILDLFKKSLTLTLMPSSLTDDVKDKLTEQRKKALKAFKAGMFDDALSDCFTISRIYNCQEESVKNLLLLAVQALNAFQGLILLKSYENNLEKVEKNRTVQKLYSLFKKTPIHLFNPHLHELKAFLHLTNNRFSMAKNHIKTAIDLASKDIATYGAKASQKRREKLRKSLTQLLVKV